MKRSFMPYLETMSLKLAQSVNEFEDIFLWIICVRGL